MWPPFIPRSLLSTHFQVALIYAFLITGVKSPFLRGRRRRRRRGRRSPPNGESSRETPVGPKWRRRRRSAEATATTATTKGRFADAHFLSAAATPNDDSADAEWGKENARSRITKNERSGPGNLTTTTTRRSVGRRDPSQPD